MSTDADRVARLIVQAHGLPDGDEQIALCEEAVRLADLHGNLKLQYLARETLVRACVFGGAAEKALVGFSWLLAQFDRNPGAFDQWAILWKYKWIVNFICDFPQIPKARIYEMLDDLEERSVRAGYGLRAVLNYRYRTEKFWDDRERAVEYFRRMEETAQDGLNNCPACEMDERVSFAVYCGRDEEAHRLALRLFGSGEECRSVPHRTYANLLMPLLRLGRRREAMHCHLKGYALIADNKSFLDRASDHLLFLTLTENFARAGGLVEKHYPWIEKSRNAFSHFRFFRAAWLLFEMLEERSRERVRLNLPRSFPLFEESGVYDCARLASWFRQKAEALAARFDERNETDFFTRTLAETPALKLLSEPFPLPAAESSDTH
jgi:hypothetical protein